MQALYLLFILMSWKFVWCHAVLYIRKVVVRVPKENDIGLIFDLTVCNNPSDVKEALELFVRSDGTCTLNITESKTICDAGRIFGGDFGSIEVGQTVTVSLIWPTVSLFNRVGHCPIVITSSNARNQETHLRQLLYFDTRYETLDPEMHSLRKHKNFRDCKNWDKDYLNDCKPVNCEERYFGRRNFYNPKTEYCEPVTPCTEPNSIYDPFVNECLDNNNFITEAELEQIKLGKFDDNFMEWQSNYDANSDKIKTAQQPESPKAQNIEEKQYNNQQVVEQQQEQQQHWQQQQANQQGQQHIQTFNDNKFPNVTNSIKFTKQKKNCPAYSRMTLEDFQVCLEGNKAGESFRSSRNINSNNFVFNWLTPLKAEDCDDFNHKYETEETDNAIESKSENNVNNVNNVNLNSNVDENETDGNTENDSIFPEWLRSLFNGLILVLATIGIYLLICFVIFLIVTWISCHSTTNERRHDICSNLTPRVSEDRFTILTKSSLLSQR